MMVTSGFARVNNGRLYFEIQGSGTPLILLTDGLAILDSHFDPLAESFQVIRYDMRGTGKSSEIGKELFSHSKDLLELLDHLSIRKATLAEITPGATIAEEFAEAYPDRVISVISAESLLNSSHENDRSPR